MKQLTKSEIRWIISALEFSAKERKKQSETASGIIQEIILMQEENDRRTANIFTDILYSNDKRISII